MTRCYVTDCIAPAVHTIRDEGNVISERCERHWQEFCVRFRRIAKIRRGMLDGGAHPRMVARIMAERVERREL